MLKLSSITPTTICLAQSPRQPPSQREPQSYSPRELHLLRAILDALPDRNGHPTLQVLRLLVKTDRDSGAAVHLERAIAAIHAECPWEAAA